MVNPRTGGRNARLASIDSTVSFGLPTIKPSDNIHLVAMQIFDCLECRVAHVLAVSACGVLCGRMQEFEITLQNVFYPRENIAKPCAVHKRSQSLSVIRYR